MLQTIIEAIIYFFVEIVYQNILVYLIAVIYWTGIAGLKVLRLSRKSFKELDEKYDDSSKPYFVGLLVIVGGVYLLRRLGRILAAGGL